MAGDDGSQQPSWHSGGVDVAAVMVPMLAASTFVINVAATGAMGGLLWWTLNNWVKTLPGSPGPVAVAQPAPCFLLEGVVEAPVHWGRLRSRDLLVCFC